VPSAQRATALRYAWARHQLAQGAAVWRTPQILTWDGWLAAQWRAAALQNLVPGRQLLDASQERMLWEAALQQLGGDDPAALLPHAAPLMRAAATANQSLLPLARMAVTEEEQLLVAALRAVQEECERRGVLALDLAPPGDFGFMAHVPAPRILGQQQLTPWQQRLQELCWPGEELLLQGNCAATAPRLQRAAHLEAEISACAQWCRERLAADGTRRLLVVSAWQDPGTHTQGELLWRAIAGGSGATDARHTWLAVEGGEALHHQALVSDALAALSLGGKWIETGSLLQLLVSPYFAFGTTAECCALQSRLGMWGMARWRLAALRQALTSTTLPAAARLLSWLEDVQVQLTAGARTATQWAECFTRCLNVAGFARHGALDSSDAQRLARWGELLDEFAGLDATLAPLGAADAVETLQRLAMQAVHQVATGDAAITFTTRMHDPLIRYDGIWVMGLTESRWPPAPRPDPYVPLLAQRHAQWPAAGVSQRLQAASWLQQRWQQCTSELVQSHARQEGDVLHRPSALPGVVGAAWNDVAFEPAAALCAAVVTADTQLPAMRPEDLVEPLRGGSTRLAVQQECAFRAQAQWRLGAVQPASFTDGIGPLQRGMLLHALLEGLWCDIQDHAGLMRLTLADQEALFARHWQAAVHANASRGVSWLAPGVLASERQRAARLITRVLELERTRTTFVVQGREQDVFWRCGGAALNLRIDRIDRLPDGSQLVVDYKSGEAGAMYLQEGAARPLQLAVYVLALQQAGMRADGALLLSLKPAKLGYAGASSVEPRPQGVKDVTDWPAVVASWQRDLAALVAQHLAGDAALATEPGVCARCHLPALCRRRAAGDALPGEESADD
jgi:ATP-dependent helicase/nuclease subunit B